MPRRSAPSRTPSTTSTSIPPSPDDPQGAVRPADAFVDRLGLPVHDRELLEQALVHSSWLHEHRDLVRGHNERLELLGDAVVNLALSEALYARPPDLRAPVRPPSRGRRGRALGPARRDRQHPRPEPPRGATRPGVVPAPR